MSRDEPVRPVNPLPPVVVALFLVVVGVEAAFSLAENGFIGGPGGIGWRSTAVQDYGFNRDLMQWMLANGTWPREHLSRFLSFAFVHGTFTHALFAGVMLLALGKFVGAVSAQWAVLVLFVTSAMAGALVFGLVPGTKPWLIGAFPGIYGLIGGFTYLMWLRLGQMGAQQFRAFSLIGVLLLVQLVFGVLFGSDGSWVAELAGFGWGFLVSFLLRPGGFARLRETLRHR